MEETKKDNKSRILYLEHYLTDHSDRENPVTTEELLDAYEKQGLKAHRNTIRDDLEALREAGIQIETVRIGNAKGYYVSNRPFELTELMVLIDSVSSSQFVSASRSRMLVRKLAAMAIEKDRKDLIATAFAANRVKTDNDVAITTLGPIAKAVKQKKKISFNYIEILPTMEVVLRHDEKIYHVSPYALIWYAGRYYAPCYDEEKGSIVPYRVDRMRNVKISNDAANLKLPFDLNQYCRSTVDMYGGGKAEEEVTLIAENDMLVHIIDRFGEDIKTEIEDDEHIRITLKVSPSYTFFSWIFEFNGDIAITAPAHVKAEYEEMLRKAIGKQKNY